jgi:hypothetical protein
VETWRNRGSSSPTRTQEEIIADEELERFKQERRKPGKPRTKKAPTESPKRSPRSPRAERGELPPLLQRLPQPEPRPRLPVRVAPHKAYPVKAAQVDVGNGRGALV